MINHTLKTAADQKQLYYFSQPIFKNKKGG